MIKNNQKRIVSILLIFLMTFSLLVEFGVTVHAANGLHVSMSDISNTQQNNGFYEINRSNQKAQIQLDITNNTSNKGSIIVLPTYNNYEPVDLNVEEIVTNEDYDYTNVDMTDFDTLGFRATSQSQIANKFKYPVHKSTVELLDTFKEGGRDKIKILDEQSNSEEIVSVNNSDLAVLSLSDIVSSTGQIKMELNFRNPGLLENDREVNVHILYSENGFKGPYKKLDNSIKYKIKNNVILRTYNPLMDRVVTYTNVFESKDSNHEYYGFDGEGKRIEQIFNAGALDKDNNLIKGSEYFQPIPPLLFDKNIESRTLEQILYFVPIPKYIDNDGVEQEAELKFSTEPQYVQIMKLNKKSQGIVLKTYWKTQKINGVEGYALVIEPADKEYLRSSDLGTQESEKSFDATILRHSVSEYQNTFAYIYRENPINVRFPDAKPGQMIELNRGVIITPKNTNKKVDEKDKYFTALNSGGKNAGYGYITKRNHSLRQSYFDGRNVQFSKSTPTNNINISNYVNQDPKLAKQVNLGNRLTTFGYEKDKLFPIITTFHKNFEGGGIIQPTHERDRNGNLVSRNEKDTVVENVRIGTIFNKSFLSTATEKHTDIKHVNLFRAKGFEYISSGTHNYGEEYTSLNNPSDRAQLDQIFDYNIIFRDRSGKEIFRKTVSKEDHSVINNNNVVDIEDPVAEHNPFEVLLEVSANNVDSPENLISVSYVDIKHVTENMGSGKGVYNDTDILYEMDYKVDDKIYSVKEISDQLLHFVEPDNTISFVHYFKRTTTEGLSGLEDNEDLIGGPINTSIIRTVHPTMFFGVYRIQSKNEYLENFKYVALLPIGLKGNDLRVIKGQSNLDQYFNYSIVDNYNNTKRSAVVITPKDPGGRVKPSDTEFQFSLRLDELSGENFIGASKEDLKFENMISFDGIDKYNVEHAQTAKSLNIIKPDKYNISGNPSGKILKMDHNVSYLSDNLINISKTVDLQEGSKGERKSDSEIHIPNGEKAIFTLNIKNNSPAELTNVDVFDMLPGKNDKNVLLSIPRYSTNSFNDFSVLQNSDYNKFNVKYAKANYENVNTFDELSSLNYVATKASDSNVVKFEIPSIQPNEEISIKIAADLNGKQYDGGEYMHNTFILNVNDFATFKPIESNLVSVMINDNYKGEVSFRKTDTNNNYLEGAEFTIRNIDTNETLKWISTLDQDDKVATLPYGNYEMKETKAPNGYSLNQEVKTFSIPSKIVPDNEVEVISFINLKLNDFTIKKVDKDSQKPIEGVKFEVYEKSNDTLVSTVVTDNNGQAIIRGLIEGKDYYVREVEAPEEYIYDSEIKYDIDLSKEELVIDNQYFLGTRDVHHYYRKSDGSTELLKEPIKRSGIVYNTYYKEDPLDTASPEYSLYKLIEMPTNAEGYQKDKHVDVNFYYELAACIPEGAVLVEKDISQGDYDSTNNQYPVNINLEISDYFREFDNIYFENDLISSNITNKEEKIDYHDRDKLIIEESIKVLVNGQDKTSDFTIDKTHNENGGLTKFVLHPNIDLRNSKIDISYNIYAELKDGKDGDWGEEGEPGEALAEYTKFITYIEAEGLCGDIKYPLDLKSYANGKDGLPGTDQSLLIVEHHLVNEDGSFIRKLTPDEITDVKKGDQYTTSMLSEEKQQDEGIKYFGVKGNPEGTIVDRETKVIYEYVEDSYSVEVIKVDGRTKQPLLPNGEDELRAEIGLYKIDNGQTVFVESKLTNEEGKVIFSDLSLSNNYIVKEIKAPRGYSINPTEYPVNKNYNEISIVNYKINEVPKTGTHGKLLFFILSSILLSLYVITKEN